MVAAAKGDATMAAAADDPNQNLREADETDANQLAGEQVAGLGDGEHDFEDAGGFFLDDGAGDVEPVHDGGHGEQDGHYIALVEGCNGVALDYGAIFLDLEGCEGDAFVDGVCCVSLAHAAFGEALVDDRVVYGVFEARWRW
jgi:hypothetical protein